MRPASSVMPGKHKVKQDDKVNSYIRERIKTARMERGISQEELAQHLKKSRVAVSDLERGRVQVGAADLVSIAIALEKPISYFYPPSVQGADANQLTPKEQEIVHLFSQLGYVTLQLVAIDQLGILAEFATETKLEAVNLNLENEGPSK